MSSKPIYITEPDLQCLTQLLRNARGGAAIRGEHLINLRAELERAQIVPSSSIPPDVVTMNSTVRIAHIEAGGEATYTLVFPDKADVEQGRISVLAPLGTAMLGYEVGDIVAWSVPAGTRRFRILEILFQPEAAGTI